MTEPIKPALKVVDLLPSIKVGKIINLFWTNGSFETPNTPLDFSDILINFIDQYAKIDWLNNDTGTITLSGDFNYLVYNDGEFFFLEKTRVVDIQKQTFVYTCVRDLKQTMLSFKQGFVKGTLVKSLDNAVLNRYLDFTKPLIEDTDEILTFPISETADKISTPVHSLKSISTEKIKKALIFDTRTLNGFLQKLSDRNSDSVLKGFKSKRGKIKLLCGAELSEFTPQKEIIKKINEWLNSTNLRLMSCTTSQLNNISPGLNARFASHKNLYLLTKVSGTDVQEKRIIEGNQDNSKVLDSNFFDLVREIKPVDKGNLAYEYLNNKSIFDFTVTTQGKVYGGFNNWYELRPRAYTALNNFGSNNECVKEAPLRYSINSTTLEQIQHKDTSGNQQDPAGNNILNNIPICYYPDFWQNKSWNEQNLSRLRDANLTNINPSVGFLLYEIWDYWKLTRGDRIERRHFNMANTKITELKIVTGLQYWRPDDSESEIDLIAESSDENFSTLTKSTKKINFGLISSEQAKLPTNAIYLNNLYTFYKEPTEYTTDLTAINNAFARNFGATYAAAFYIDDKTITTTLKTSIKFNLNTSISAQPIEVQGLSNLELLKACYQTYTKIKSLTTLTKTISLTNAININDYFWSNATWVFGKDGNIRDVVDLKKPQVVLLYGPNNASYSDSYDFRFSKLTLIDPEPQLAKENNLIRTDDPSQTLKNSKLYPWIVKEKKIGLNIAPVINIPGSRVDQHKQYRNNKIKELYKSILDHMEKNIFYSGWNSNSGWYADIVFYKGNQDKQIYKQELTQILLNSVDNDLKKYHRPQFVDLENGRKLIKFYDKNRRIIATIKFRLDAYGPNNKNKIGKFLSIPVIGNPTNYYI